MGFLRILSAVMLFGVIAYSCEQNDPIPVVTDYNLHLRWNKAFETETAEDVVLGLSWAMSYLGAELPKQTYDSAIVWLRNDLLKVDFSLLGFSDEALLSMHVILTKIRSNEEYTMMGGIDVGRFIMLTLSNPNHYYKLTEAKDQLRDFENLYQFDKKSVGITNSGVAFEHRLIEISEGKELEEIAFIAYEGSGSLLDDTFEHEEIEVMDFMPNGQVKFALYNKQGNLKTGASKELTRAGKPAKCLWCHDLSLQSIHKEQEDVVNMLNQDEFNSLIESLRKVAEEYRIKRGGAIDLNDTRSHTIMEYLYLSFMEPSAERLAQEWGLSITQVKSLLQGNPTHPQHEFIILGERLYNRHDIEHLAPYSGITVSESARETSSMEINLFD